MIQIPLKISPTSVRSFFLRILPISTTDQRWSFWRKMTKISTCAVMANFPPAGKHRMTNCLWCVTCSLKNDTARSVSLPPPPPPKKKRHYNDWCIGVYYKTSLPLYHHHAVQSTKSSNKNSRFTSNCNHIYSSDIYTPQV